MLKFLKGTMNNYLSLKFKVISFFAIILVVFLHSYNLIVKVDADNVLSLTRGYSTFIQEFISPALELMSSCQRGSEVTITVIRAKNLLS